MKKKRSTKLIHYRRSCIGCGVCADKCPKYWRIDKNDGKAKLVNSIEKNGVYVRNIDIEDLDDNREVADLCPVNIIKVD